LAWAEDKTQALGSLSKGQGGILRLAYFGLARARDRARARVRERENALEIALTSALKLTRWPIREYSRERERVLALASKREQERQNEGWLGLLGMGKRELEHALASLLHPEIAVDYAFYYAWAVTNIITEVQHHQDEHTVLRFLHSLPEFCVEIGASVVAARFRQLLPQRSEDDDIDWSAFADALWKIMKDERGFPPQREVSPGESQRIENYLYAVELLVRCLDLAYVTNRQEILDNLLRPPSPPPTD
jgi:hypothetical protein